MPNNKSVRKVGKHHEKNAKAVVSIMVLLVALSVLYIFKTYQDNVLTSSFQLFVFLTTGLFGLLMVLLFLLGKSSKS